MARTKICRSGMIRQNTEHGSAGTPQDIQRSLLAGGQRRRQGRRTLRELVRLGAGYKNWIVDRQSYRAERFRDLSPVPAADRPRSARLGVERQERAAGRAGEPDGARLGDPGGAARAVQRNPRRMPPLYLVLQ